MGRIIIRAVKTYAFHGCLPAEKKIGGIYKTTIWIDGDFAESEKKDDLTKTVDYETVTSIILEEMKQSSDLIEHVARRILNKTFLTFSNIKKLKVKIVKIKPPVSADIPQVEYILKKKR